MHAASPSFAESLLDQSLARLHATDAEFDEPPYAGLTNHAPMVVEALVAMHQPDAVAPFLAAYAPKLRPAPPPGRPIPEAERLAALGDPGRAADWVVTFEAQLAHEDPAAVVARELPRLADGTVAAALHALIRTGHALRALGRRDDPVRRRELAHALGYWAATHQRLPGRPGARAVRGRDALTMLRALPRVEAANRQGLISDRVAQVDRLPGFINAIETVDLDALGVHDTVTALVDACAHLYLSTPGSRFVYLHGITGTSMLRIVGPWLDDAGRQALLRGTVHALAALHATHADPKSTLQAPLPPLSLDLEAVARRAAASRDDHTIKLVEALLREHRHAPRVVLLHVAHDRLSV